MPILIPTERTHCGFNVASKRGCKIIYLDKRKESALVLGGELLRFALGRHDSGIVSLPVISSNDKKQKRIYVRNWDENNACCGQEEVFEMHLSLDDLIWNLGQFGG